MANQGGMDEEKIRRAELSALVEMGLGEHLDEDTFHKLADIQSSLRSEQEKLASLLEIGKISDKKYLLDFNQALRHAMEESKMLLGDKRFKSIFGYAGTEPEKLIDPKIFINGQLRRD
jgi:hypothetical protein